MNETIKSWIKQQSEFAGNASCDNAETVEYYFGEGLTKGIEIAEGFAEWAVKNYFLDYSALGHVKGWSPKSRISEIFTTSQLLEKYLEYLSSINKES